MYLATLNRSGALVQCAVKMLRPGASATDSEDFIHEAETMAALGTNANIVSLLGAVVEQRPWLVVLEFVQYGDLREILSACKQKSIAVNNAERMLFAEQIALGCAFIISKGYVHNDLACRNCLVGDNNSIKIADFGLTRPFDAGLKTYRQKTVLKLSVRWLDVTAHDSKVFSEASDVWSFGVTVWDMFNYGALPWGNVKNLLQIIARQRSGERLPRPDDCPDNIWELISSCWMQDRARRPTFEQVGPSMVFSLLAIY